ncbi:homoserine kinase [Gorillibacterium timonense]|uniref:homoserine kinase n=1 Tax=Gorillibacterium timonense TaxID=1689269 RepID=UPI00071E3FF3|nr:homoserine kinase [Gorillibacterium timonense]
MTTHDRIDKNAGTLPETTVVVKVPASTANLGPGFDSLGMALELYTWIAMSIAEKTVVHLHGEQTEGLPDGKDNLLYEVAVKVFERAGLAAPELEISNYSEIPLTRGLGSSAAAIVGALAAANALLPEPLPVEELFRLACTLEHHPDNVGASLFGGIVVAYWDGTEARHIGVQPLEHLESFVAIPDFELSTRKAREVLPQSLPLKDAVFNIGHSNLLVAAFCSGRYELIADAMQDALHQPYRARLIPGMPEVLAGAASHGALGAALSGAGPTLIALADAREEQGEELTDFLKNTMAEHGIDVSIRRLKPSREGVRVLTLAGNHRTFMETVRKE